MVDRLLEKFYGKPVRTILYDLYIKQNMTMKEVAEELSVSVGWVNKRIREYNLYKVNENKCEQIHLNTLCEDCVKIV